MNRKDRPIGVFDSGIGGLTVLKEIIKEMPNESTIYLGDTARVPYGIRSPEAVTRYSLENTRFLYSKDIKLLVVACNTASSISLESIRKDISIPVVGVIEPGAKAAVRTTKNKRVGVIGTEATIRSNSYAESIKSLDEDIEVFQLPCPLFVPIVEEGWIQGEIATMIAEKYLKGMRDKYIDTLVLGCTHYPLLKGVISEVMGDSVTLIDSAVEVAKEIRGLLEASDLRNEGLENGLMKFYVTDSPERFLKVGELFLRTKIKNIEVVKLQ